MRFLILFISLTLLVIPAAPPKSLSDRNAKYGVVTGLQSFKVICQDCFHGEVAFLKIRENGYMTSSRDKRVKTDVTVYLDPCQDHEFEVKATLQNGAEKVKTLYYKMEACTVEDSKGSSNSSWPRWTFVIVAYLSTILI